MKGEAFDVRAEDEARTRAAQAAELAKLTEDTDLQWLMSTQQGRRFMWRLLSMSGVYRLSYAGEQTHETAFAEGARNIGLQLMHDVQTLCPDLYAVMVEEQRSARSRQS